MILNSFYQVVTLFIGQSKDVVLKMQIVVVDDGM